MSKKSKEVVNLLELTPRQNKEFEDEEGIVTILIPKFRNAFMKSLIPKHKSPDIRIKLDELGSAVWRVIDGKTKVESIISDLSEKLGGKIAPAEERISKFFTQIHQYKFVKFIEIEQSTKKS